MIHASSISSVQPPHTIRPVAPRDPRDTHNTMWLLLFGYMLMVGLYFIGRYAGRWAENDSAVLSDVIRNFISEGRLIPRNGPVYDNGYAYQVISSYIVAITGLDVGTLQQLIYPFLAAFIIFPAWVVFREITNSERGAAIATALLMVQPEFLFVILRSSHEKFTRLFLMLCLYFLVRSFKLIDRPWLLAAHVMLFYVCSYAMITCNSFLGNSFIGAVVASLVFGWLLSLRRSYLGTYNKRLTQRLLYASLASLGLAFLFSFYLYPPARETLILLQSLSQRIAALFLDVQTKPVNSYSQVIGGWASLPAYFIVSIANWLILAGSALIWFTQLWRWVVRRQAPQSQNAWLLMLLYAAFVIQGVASIVADASGFLANLQHRIFPSFSLLAVAVVGAFFAQWQPPRYRLFPVGVMVIFAIFSLLSVVKATNDPLVSNTWTFYHPAEINAVQWDTSHLTNEEVWTEFDERVATALITKGLDRAKSSVLRAGDLRATTRNAMVSSITRLRSVRSRLPIPVPRDALQIYDNGTAQVYHLRPLTPFQR